MKICVAAFLAFGSAVTAYGGHAFDVPEGSTKLALVEGTLDNVTVSSPRCRPGAMCSPTSVANLSFGLSGCFNELGPVTANIVRHGGKTILNVTAYEFLNPESLAAFCVTQAMGYANIFLGTGFYAKEDVVVNFQKTIQNSR